MANQTITGKGFEYACLQAFQEELAKHEKSVEIEESKPYNTAKDAYEKLSKKAQSNYMSAARTAVKLIFPLEPMIEDGTNAVMLSLNSDSKGIDGDVRDLLCIRTSDDWEIGISCKHQHEALKHPRITKSCDFGYDWMGYHCSKEFIDSINNILDPLVGDCYWRDVDYKHERFYVPILEAFIKEITNICKDNQDAPSKLLGYFFGVKDFYKIISKESAKQTKIMGFNMYGTMNKSSKTRKPIYKVAKLHMPTRLIEASLKNGSNTTMILTFDGGWTVSMRLHNKDDVAKATSLAWDVNLIGLPPEIYQQQRSWNE